MLKWNYVKTNLPPTQEPVLVQGHNGKYSIAWYDESTQNWFANEDLFHISAQIQVDGEMIKFWTMID
jgi:hypothetical protein